MTALDVQGFSGDWQLQREITDRQGGVAGRMSGQATLAPDGPVGLLYAERGRLQMGDGPVLEAERRYLWRFAGGRVEVRFADGADFHSFAPHGAAAGTVHYCGDDVYRVAYDFTGWPVWTATWAASGPRKDYVSVSRYWR